MKTLLLLLAIALITPAHATIPSQLAPSLEAIWRNDVLEVAAWQPGCLYLIGNGRPNQLIGCDQLHYTLWPYGDQQYVPMNRTLVLRDELNQREIARLAVPPRVLVWMPLAAN